MWAYYNITDDCSYIYANNEWQLFARNGADGATSSSETGITWLGSYASADQIYNPQKLDAYYNTTENCAYIYNGSKWTVLINGPASGATGGSSSTNTGSTTGANVFGSTLLSWDNPEGVIRIPNGVTDISAEVFKNKDKITKVIIPSSVVSIGSEAFRNCDGLTSVEFLGSGLEIIGAQAFRDCDKLQSVVFSGNTLQSIGAEAFYSCPKLTSITLPTSLKSIGSSGFYHCTSLTTIIIPNSVTSIGSRAFCGCQLLRSVSIGSGLTTLSDLLFGDCDSIISFTIPDTVTSIAESVFGYCDSLVSLSVSGNWKYNYNGAIAELTISGLKDVPIIANATVFYWTRVTN